MLIWSFLLLLAAAFVVFAIYSNYARTTGTVPARVWASILAALALAAAWAVTFFGGVPPPTLP